MCGQFLDHHACDRADSALPPVLPVALPHGPGVRAGLRAVGHHARRCGHLQHGSGTGHREPVRAWPLELRAGLDGERRERVPERIRATNGARRGPGLPAAARVRRAGHHGWHLLITHLDNQLGTRPQEIACAIPDYEFIFYLSLVQCSLSLSPPKFHAFH